MSLPPLPDIEPYIDKCGKGTAWIGAMIREQMRQYGQQCYAAGAASRDAEVADLRGEIGRLQEVVDANWVSHQTVVAARNRAERAEAALRDEAEAKRERGDRIVELEAERDALRQKASEA